MWFGNDKMKKIGLGLVALLACGEPTAPIPNNWDLKAPGAEWTAIDLYVCPKDVKTQEECTLLQDAAQTLESNLIYIHRHAFDNYVEYVEGRLRWEHETCSEYGNVCERSGIWAVEEGKLNLGFGIEFPTRYRFDYNLLNGAQKILNDTTLFLRFK